MKKRKNDKKQKKSMLLLLILLGISVGFALLSTTLKINGTASIKGNTWDIHWENVVPNGQSTVTTETPVIGDSGTSVTYDVELALPGDFYEFTVDAVNDGSINAKIDDIRHTVKQVTIVNEEEVETDATLPSYILYSVVYDGTNTAPAEGDLLGAHSSKTYKVRIEYDPLATTVPENDLVYRITDEFDYEQTKEVDIQGLLANIEADPDSYRNPEQSVANKDIGVDKYGNVINLDWWVDKNWYEGEKIYFIDTNTNEIRLGAYDGNCIDGTNGNPNECKCYYTGATSSANVVDGKWQLTLPEYIYDDATSKFYPVTEINYIFETHTNCSLDYDENLVIDDLIELLPETVTTIGYSTFYYNSNIKNIIIPKTVKEIGAFAFLNSIEYQAENTLVFESGSQLEKIGDFAFRDNNLKGNLILPQTVTYIGLGAFEDNNLTSVTFPSSATYFENQQYEYDNSFDSNVVINHNY